MPVVLLLAVLAVLAGVVVVARGQGGELAMSRPDTLPRRLPLTSPADMAAYRPPSAFFGYSVTATDDALLQMAEAVAERDEQLALLRRELAELRGHAPAPGPRPPAADPAESDPAPGYPGPGFAGEGYPGAGFAGWDEADDGDEPA